MSRLDDELRKVFRREQPPVDFTARLLERVAQQPAPKARWWSRLATLLEPPNLRWVAIGVTASLLLAIGAAQYSRLHQVVVNDKDQVSLVTAPLEEGIKNPVSPDQNNDRQGVMSPKPPQNKRVVDPSLKHRVALARQQQERELRVEGEAAKEKLMLALSIASAALNDAQKAVHDDGLRP
jgi:hypothetical protein